MIRMFPLVVLLSFFDLKLCAQFDDQIVNGIMLSVELEENNNEVIVSFKFKNVSEGDIMFLNVLPNLPLISREMMLFSLENPFSDPFLHRNEEIPLCVLEPEGIIEMEYKKNTSIEELTEIRVQLEIFDPDQFKSKSNEKRLLRKFNKSLKGNSPAVLAEHYADRKFYERTIFIMKK